MSIDRIITVNQSDVSQAEADIVEQYFVAPLNNPDRPNLNFSAAISHYDQSTGVMSVDACLSPRTSPEAGRIAVEQAFRFAEALTSSL